VIAVVLVQVLAEVACKGSLALYPPPFFTRHSLSWLIGKTLFFPALSTLINGVSLWVREAEAGTKAASQNGREETTGV